MAAKVWSSRLPGRRTLPGTQSSQRMYARRENHPATRHPTWMPGMNGTSARSGITILAMDGTYLLATSVQPLPAPVQALGSAKDDALSPFLYVEPRGAVRPGENPP